MTSFGRESPEVDPADRFRAVVEHSSEGFLILDVAGRVVYANPSTGRILGCAVAELLGRPALELVHPDDRECVKTLFAAIVGAPRTTRCASFRALHKTGPTVWVGTEMKNLVDEPGVLGVVATCRDITAQQLADQSLHKAEQRLEMLSRAIEQTADSVFVTNRDGVIEYVNPAFEALTGFSREDAIGRTSKIFSSGLHDARFFQTLWQKILSGQVFRTIVTNKAKDGRLYDEDQTITPIRDSDGTITHFVATGRDITQRKRTQEALRRLNTQLEQEAARIAGALHDEAGQFLTSAHITLKDVARDLAPPARERLQEVRRNLDELEEQLRRVSRELHPRILDDLGLLDAIKFVANAVSRRIGVRITVDAALERRCPHAVEAVLYRFVQEALTNIGKHARASGGTIGLFDCGDGVCCSIRDDGVGFDVAATLSRPGELGLGLRGIQDRFEAVGGIFEIVSAPGAGTELRATVPLES